MIEKPSIPKDGASRQAKFKDEQRKLGRRRLDLWVTESERRTILETLEQIRNVQRHPA